MKLLAYAAILGGSCFLYEWPATHHVLVSPQLRTGFVNFGIPAALLFLGWVHIRGGFATLNRTALFNHLFLLSAWTVLFTATHRVSSVHQFLHTAWPVKFTVAYFAALAIAMPIAAWRRRRLYAPARQPAPGGALQRYQPQGQQLRPHGSSVPMVRGAAFPVRTSPFDGFTEMVQAKVIDLANNHQGPMRVFYAHERDEDGNEHMISHREWRE